VNWIAADILRIEDGNLVEHWDVIQDEAIEEQSKKQGSDVRRKLSHLRVSCGVSFAVGYDQRDIVVLLVGAEPLYFFHHEREQPGSG
jgi:hypothetical protein